VSAEKSRIILIGLGIALLAVIVLPLLFMGVMMGGMMTSMMGGGGMMWGWGLLAVVILVVGAGLIVSGLAHRS
jgi:hypothetical protein